MANPSHVLGMNARNQYYGAMNRSRAKRRANSKLATKKYLSEKDIPVPKLYGVIRNREELNEFSFEDIDTSIVIKPSGGSGGKGILILRKPKKKTGVWIGPDGRSHNERDLRLHVEDILEGQYSSVGTRSRAFIEERVSVHQKFKKYVKKGVPDVRVIVFNSVPVMAMLRLPTQASEGKANLHQGGIGLGVDIATGITLYGVHNGKKIKYLPDSKIKLNGIKIPYWTKTLQAAVAAANEIGLAFSGVDLLIHPEKGPMVIELNARPGLAIQLANGVGLRFRLERVEGLSIRNVDHGIKVGKALFAERFADQVKASDGLVIVNTNEIVRVQDAEKKWHEVPSLIDSGIYRSTIDREFAHKAGLLDIDNILWSNSKQTVIEVACYLKDKKIKSAFSVVKRTKGKAKISIGRRDLQGFLINPQKTK